MQQSSPTMELGPDLDYILETGGAALSEDGQREVSISKRRLRDTMAAFDSLPDDHPLRSQYDVDTLRAAAAVLQPYCTDSVDINF